MSVPAVRIVGHSNMTLTMEKAEHLAKPCPRCGQEIPGYVMERRNRRNAERVNCADCEAGKRTQIKNGNEICIPWMGEIDLDTLTPVNRDGSPYMPGNRYCGNKDCVNVNHVSQPISEMKIFKTDDELTAEQFSVYYRTKRHRNYEQLVRAVKKEARQR